MLINVDHPNRFVPLQENILFNGVPAEELGDIVHSIREHDVPAGATIFDVGDASDKIYMVSAGEIETSREEAGHQVVFATILPGAIFGEMSFFRSLPRSARATAKTDARIGILEQDCFWALVARIPTVLRNLAVTLTDRIRATNDLRMVEALREDNLRDLGNRATEFAHSLRNKCTALIGYAEDLSSEPGLAQEVLRITQEIASTAQNALDQTRVKVIVPVHQIVRSLDLHVVARTGIRLVEEVKGDLSVKVDRERFAAALQNIIKNAHEAMPQGGELRVMVRQVNGYVLFSISDTGPGIHASIAGTVLSSGATFGKTNGSGCGLPSTNKVVQEHGGFMRFVSTSTGTTFRIYIPVAL